MEKVMVTGLSRGKCYSSPVFLDDKYILLSPEIPVSEQLVDRLLRWSYTHVLTDGQPGDAAAGGTTENPGALLENDLREQSEFTKAYDFFKDLVNQTELLFAEFMNKNTLPTKDVTELVRKIIEAMKEQKNYLLRISELEAPEKTYLVAQSVRTALLGVALGQFQKLPNFKLIEVGMSCLMHEIGMVKLPPALYMSAKVLTPQEKRAITAHTLLGYKILKEHNFPIAVCIGVLESHENIDGSGYPRGLAGDKISPYARIVSISSTFSALSSARPFRHAFDGHAVILELLKGMGRRYDETLVRLLVANLSVFPIGTYVQLASGAKGQVIQPNEQDAKSPLVRLLVNASGDRYGETPMVKTDVPENRISRALTAQQVKELRSMLGVPR